MLRKSLQSLFYSLLLRSHVYHHIKVRTERFRMRVLLELAWMGHRESPALSEALLPLQPCSEAYVK